MGSERREISTRQVRVALVLIGVLVVTATVMLRREPEAPVSPDDGVGQPVASTGPQLPDNEFAAGLEDPEEQWRQVAEHAGITISDVNEALAQADLALSEDRLIEPRGDNALDLYLAVQAFDPGNEDAAQGLALVRHALIQNLEAALDRHDMAEIQRWFPSLDRIASDDEDVEALAAEVSRMTRAAQLLEQALADLEAGRVIQPSGDNALARVLRAAELDPDHPDLEQVQSAVERTLIERALNTARERNFVVARNWLGWAGKVRGGSTAVDHATDSVDSYQRLQIQQIENEAKAALLEGRFDQAGNHIARMRQLRAPADQLERLEQALALARVYGNFQPGQVFSDVLDDGHAVGPEMAVMPAGSFLMGSAHGEPGHTGHEEPVHRVVFARGFALSRTEVTVALFRRFVEATGYLTDAETEGFTTIYNEQTGRNARSRRATWRDGYNGRGAADDEPVVHVSWNDAAAFADWLRIATDAPYRLPSESEFEYGLRAGSDSLYWWGSGSPDRPLENTTGDGDRSRRRHLWNKAFEDYDDGYWGPAPVASFEANPFGLFDMAGNVQEWVQDCWHDSYVRAPADGRAWVNRGCERRVVRGGFWGGEPSTARSAYRSHHLAETRASAMGFRVARDLISPPASALARLP